ncbi:MAG: hypothetical protein JW957_04520 [Candidatus Omnitrophica bacterium]|nr:hypothetical protein [Candidatus Omnitrophota bacterium]
MGKDFKKLLAAIGLSGLLLAFGIACGGGGGGGSSSVSIASGTGFKGPVMDGDITVSGLAGNTLEGLTELSTTTTDEDGQYMASLAGFEGNVLVELAGGTYIDEATGTEMGNALLRALVPDASDSVSAMVTPFTEIAYRLWEALLGTPGELTISQANAIAANVAGVANVLGTDPVLVTDPEKAAAALQSQIEYGLAAAMLSQYAESNFLSMDAAIQSIVDDLLDDMQLNSTGGNLLTALETFLSDTEQNQSGIGGTGQTIIDETITFIADNPFNPALDSDGLTKAKELVSDLRDTTLFVYNYTGSGAPGLIEPFFKKVADEVTANFPYELPERIYILIKAAIQIDVDALMGGTPQVVVVDGVTVTFTYNNSTEPGETEGTITATFVMENIVQCEGVIGQGTVTYEGLTEIPDISDPADIFALLPIEADIDGDFTFGTTVINVDIDAVLDASLQQLLQSTAVLTLNGDMTVTTGVVSGEVSAMPAEEMQLLYSEGTIAATIQLETDGTVLLTRLTSEGTTTVGTTAELEGDLVMTFVQNEALEGELISFLPNSLTANGTITELGTDTPVILTGSLTAGLDNADTFDPNAEWSELNYAQWDAVFNGEVSREGLGSVTVLLDAEQSAWNTIEFDASYHMAKGGKTVFLQGGGTYTFPESTTEIKALTWDWSDYGSFEAEFTNQTGTVLYLSSEISSLALELTGPVIGYIETAGGEQMAEIVLKINGPYVTYTDGYEEYIFPLVK